MLLSDNPQFQKNSRKTTVNTAKTALKRERRTDELGGFRGHKRVMLRNQSDQGSPTVSQTNMETLWVPF